MKKIICDVCNKEEASRGFKVKMRRKWPDDLDNYQHWGRYRKIDICGKCAVKILNMTYVGSNGIEKNTLPDVDE